MVTIPEADYYAFSKEPPANLPTHEFDVISTDGPLDVLEASLGLRVLNALSGNNPGALKDGDFPVYLTCWRKRRLPKGSVRNLLLDLEEKIDEWFVAHGLFPQDGGAGPLETAEYEALRPVLKATLRSVVKTANITATEPFFILRLGFGDILELWKKHRPELIDG